MIHTPAEALKRGGHRFPEQILHHLAVEGYHIPQHPDDLFAAELEREEDERARRRLAAFRRRRPDAFNRPRATTGTSDDTDLLGQLLTAVAQHKLATGNAPPTSADGHLWEIAMEIANERGAR